MTPGRIASLTLGAALAFAACSGGDDAASDGDQPETAATESSAAAVDTTPVTVTPGEFRSFGPAPEVPEGPLADDTVVAVDAFFDSLDSGVDYDALDVIRTSGDARLAWLVTDVLRFVGPGQIQDELRTTFEELTGTEVVVDRSVWGTTTDHLLAWDLPAPPGYVNWKAQVFTLIEPDWAPFFEDADATIDWRWVSWGGVLIDDREIERTDSPCLASCIPALNDPELTDAAGGDWYDDDRIVFGVVVGDEAVAFPKNIMEVHEMVNMTIGGRRIGMPYCTLCGSAQAYFTDDVIDADGVGPTYELRTSGLLSRSNKVMFEFHTRSVFDTFTGEAVVGPLREAGVQLEEISVRTTTWGDWKEQHPDTRIVAEDGGLGRDYPEDPLRGRDDDGPIFPIGNVDPRLEVQAPVLGVVLDDGTPLAFPADAAEAVLAQGGDVTLAGVTLQLDAAGLVAVDGDGDPVAAHEAFWFAWSQFHPDTELWLP